VAGLVGFSGTYAIELDSISDTLGVTQTNLDITFIMSPMPSFLNINTAQVHVADVSKISGSETRDHFGQVIHTIPARSGMTRGPDDGLSLLSSLGREAAGYVSWMDATKDP